MTHTSSRTWQWLGIIVALSLLAGGYWYFAVRAGVKVNTNAGPEVGDGGLGAGLVGYWKLDEGTGTSAANASVNTITALTLTNGPTWTTGQIGSAIDFDGTDDYATTADTATLDFGDTDDITITGWFNRTTSFNTIDTVVAKRNSNTAADIGYIVNIDNTTDLIALEVSDGTDEYSITSATSFTSAGWHHFAFVWDQDSATNVEVYIDGRDDNGTKSGTIGNIGDLSNAVAFRLGAESDNGNPFDGLIDEARVYDRALSPAEINDLYKLTAPTGVDTGLVGYWAFGADDFRSTLVSDRSGGRNTGTLVNTPTKTVGKIGQALNFASASTQYVNAGSGAIVDDIVNLSTCAWVKPNSSLTTYGDITTKYNNSGLGWQMLLDYSTFSNLGISFYRTFSTTAGWWFGTTTIPYNQWSHVCVTYNNSSVANDPVFYVNGALTTTYENQAPVGTASSEATGDMYIGAYNNTGTPGELFDGVIDEARVYNRIITASEVKSLYDAGSANKANTSAAQPAGSGNPESSLVGYWPLDEGTGTSAADASVNATAAGTLTNGPTWGTGRIGSAVTFDGTNDYIALSDPANGVLDFGDTDDMTIAGWFNRSTYTTVDAIVSKWDGTNPGYRVYIDDSADALNLEVFDGTDTYSVAANGYAITSAGWHHFVAVWDQDSPANSEIYVDGLPLAATDSGTIGNIGTLANTIALSIGDTPGAGLQFAGSLDEIRIYDRAYSAEDVIMLYNQTAATGVDTGLRGYWSMNAQDMTSTLAFDRSGSRNTGTLSGAVRGIGRVGQALNFDGTNDYVDNSNSAVLKPTNFTLSTWTYADTGDATTYRLIFNPSYSDSGWDNGWSLSQADDTATSGPYVVRWGDGTNPSAGTITGSTNIVGGWHHAVVTFDGTTMSLYVDGVLENSANASTLAYSGTNLNSYTGGGGSGGLGLNYFDGRIDETRLYSRALSTAEVKALYDIGTPDKTNTSVSTPQGTGRADSGLVGYWKLDDGSGTSASDASVNGNAGTLTNGPTWTTGQIGSAVSFDGTNDYIGASSSSAFTDLSRFTACTWVNPIDNGSSFPGVVNTFNVGLTSGWDLYLINGYTGGHGIGTSFKGTSSSGYIEANRAVVPFSQWTHVCASQDGDSTTNMRLYVNGSPTSADSSGNATGRQSDAGNQLSVGRYPDASDYYSGQLDEVRIYSRVLSADEVAQLYRLSAPTGTDTGLVGYWSFNGQDMAATTAYDRSGAGNTGTLTNSPTKVIGKLGQGVSLDGTDDYVAVSGLFSSPANITVAGWAKLNSADTSGATLISLGDKVAIDLDSTSPGGLTGFYYDGTTWNQTSNLTYYAGTGWHHYAYTFDDTANTQVLYVDGTAVKTTSYTNSISYTGGAGTRIGMEGQGNTSNNFNGLIDEVRVYNRALSAAEVQALYNSGR